MAWEQPLPKPCILPNERGIELPLAMEACEWATCGGLILDAGAALNCKDTYGRARPPGRIWHYTESLDAEQIVRRGGSHVSYLCGDLRLMEFADGTFDHVACVSTLEHVGLDNTEYGGKPEDDTQSWRMALAEMWRVLKPGGTLFLSAPAGQTGMIAESRRYRAFSLADLEEMELIVGGSFARRYFYADPPGEWHDTLGLPPFGLEPPQEKQRVIGLACLKRVKPCAS